MAKYLDSTGLTHLWAKIKAYVQGYVTLSNSTITIGSNSVTPVVDSDYVHTDNNYTDDEKTKLSNIASGAEVNVVKSVNQTAGTSGVNLSLSSAGALDVTISSGSVASGNSNFVTGGTVYTAVNAKADKATTLSGYGITDAKIASGTITLGSNSITPLTEHQDISGKADLASPTFTGTPKAPTATAGTNTTQIATTAFVTTAISNASSDYVSASVLGVASGVATLDSTGKVPSDQLPSYVDDVVEAYIVSGATALGSGWLATESATGTVITPEAGVIYVIMNGTDTYPTNSQYRWGGSAYVKLNDGGVSAITNSEIDSITAN